MVEEKRVEHRIRAAVAHQTSLFLGGGIDHGPAPGFDLLRRGAHRGQQGCPDGAGDVAAPVEQNSDRQFLGADVVQARDTVFVGVTLAHDELHRRPGI